LSLVSLKGTLFSGGSCFSEVPLALPSRHGRRLPFRSREEITFEEEEELSLEARTPFESPPSSVIRKLRPASSCKCWYGSSWPSGIALLFFLLTNFLLRLPPLFLLSGRSSSSFWRAYKRSRREKEPFYAGDEGLTASFHPLNFAIGFLSFFSPPSDPTW